MMTFKSTLTALLLVLFPIAFFAQGSAELEKAFTDKFGYKEKAMKKAPRKIYLKEFSVYYQVMGAASDKSSGGGYRTTVVGATKTTMGVALEGPSVEQLQTLTNQLYTNYIDELKEQGFSFISADDAAATDTYEGWTRYSGGGEPSVAQVGGYLAFTPAGADFFYRKQTSTGKTKGSVLIDNANKLSRDLDDAIVATVSLVVPFVELEAGTTIKLATMGSKVKAKVKLELAAQATEQEVKSGGLMASFAQPDKVSTLATYTSGKGAGATADSYIQHGLKKNVPINGVTDQKKIVERIGASRSSATTSNAYNLAGHLMVSAEDREAKASHLVEVDGSVYQKEVGDTLRAFLERSLSAFLEVAK